MKRGDWIELRDAPNTRGVVKHVGETVTLLLSGDYDLTTFPVAELHDHWEQMRFDERDQPPFWIRPEAVFVKMDPRLRDEDLYAEIVDVKPGWVAYYVKYAIRSRAPCFFMTRFWEFRKVYEAVKPPSAWDHLLNGDD